MAADTTLDQHELAALRAQLERDRESLVAELRSSGADPHGDRVDIEGVDEGFADLAAATSERAEALALVAAARERLAETEQALARMDDGTYGRCAGCGTDIPAARLEFRPTAARCVDCAAAA